VPAHFFEYFIVGALGALASELLNLYEFRGKLPQKRFQALARAPLFWIVGFGMILSSGFIAWAVNAASDVAATPLQVVLTGIGARGIVRGTAAARAANSPATLGGDAEVGESVRLKDILL
jgi:hypothetical protein